MDSTLICRNDKIITSANIIQRITSFAVCFPNHGIIISKIYTPLMTITIYISHLLLVVTFCIYEYLMFLFFPSAEAIYTYCGGNLTVTGGTPTAGIFATYPAPYLSLMCGFIDQVARLHLRTPVTGHITHKAFS